MKPCGILLFPFILWKIAEPVTIMKIQAVQTADLFDFILPRLQTVLPDTVGLWLKRNESDIIPVLNQPLQYPLLCVFLTEPIGSYRFSLPLGRMVAYFRLGLKFE